jgi:hypothetical protein
MVVRRKMSCFIAAGKNVNDIWAITRQLPMTTIEELLEAVFSAGSLAVFSAGSLSRLYSEDSRPAE